MTDLKQFRKNAAADGLCAEYSAIWDNCQSKVQIMEMCLGAKGLDYLCDAYAKGWGITSDAILSSFSRFINGKYIYDNGKYSSTIYCEYKGIIEANTTAICLIDCDAEIILKENYICEVYATGKCKLKFVGIGSVVLVAYGKEEDVVSDNEPSVKIKRIQKKEKDSYEGD